MRILINATSARLGGGITVLRNLLPELLAADGGENKYIIVAPRRSAEAIDPGDRRVELVLGDDSGSLARRLAWEQLEVPVIARRARAELIFSPAGLAVFAAATPQVLMYQNMAPFEPEVQARATPALARRMFLLRNVGLLSARFARQIVFISRYAQRSIIPQLGNRALDSRCVYLGRDEAFGPERRSPAELANLGFDTPYLLSVSQLYFYKNFVELVAAFAQARPRLPQDLKLAIVGAEPDPDYAARVREEVKRHGLEGAVLLTGGIPYHRLPAVYAGARAFLFPSMVENFPNILVEAMSSGVPTYASDRGPMPEIAGDGACYFDPTSVASIAEALVRASAEDAHNAALAARGIRRAKRYSWRQTAEGVLGAFADAFAPGDVRDRVTA